MLGEVAEFDKKKQELQRKLDVLTSLKSGQTGPVRLLDELNHAYEEFFAKPYNGTQVLKIETDPLNIIQNPEHLKIMENRIRQSLGLSPFQPVLPLAEAD